MRYADGITFGFELEFICVFADKQFREHTKELQYFEETRAGAVIQHYLKAHGVHATGQEKPSPVYPDAMDTDDMDMDEMDIDDEPEEDVAPPYSRWRVDEDSSLHLSQAELAALPAGYKEDPVEIASPKFYARDMANMVSQLHKVMTALRAMERDTGCLFLTNDTCGFHVHIGHADGGPTVAIAKRVMQLFTAHERTFDALHLVNRIVNMPYNQQNNTVPCYAPLSFFGRHYQVPADEVPPESLGHNPLTWHEQDFRPARSPTDGLFPTNPFTMLARIEETTTFDELGALQFLEFHDGFISGHSCTVNLDNLYADENNDRHEETLTHTIEFRQHAGTLDQEEITNYVKFLIRAVVYCESVKDVAFFELLITGASDKPTHMQLLWLLTQLNLSTDERQFLCRDKTKDRSAPPGLQLSQQPLVALNIANHVEKCANYDPRKVQERIENKLVTRYYGWDPEILGVVVTPDRIPNLLHVANYKIRDNPTLARTYAFAALSRMYYRFHSPTDRTGHLEQYPTQVELIDNWWRPDFE